MVRPLFFIASTLMLLLSTLLTSVFAEDDTSNAEKTATAKTSEFQPGVGGQRGGAEGVRDRSPAFSAKTAGGRPPSELCGRTSL